MRVVGYSRVSTRRQATDGTSLEEQAYRLDRECEQREGTQLVELVEEIRSSTKKRPLLEATLKRLDAGEFDALMVARLDRSCRSTAEFALMLDRAQRTGKKKRPWQIIMLDPAVDTTSPYGRAFAQMGAVFAELERSLCAQRQRDSVAERKRAGTYRNNQPEVEPAAVEAMLRLHRSGYGPSHIARTLDAMGLVPPRAEAWSYRTVDHSLRRALAEAA